MMPLNTRRTILVADDHPLVADALVQTLAAAFPGLEVVKTGNLAEAITQSSAISNICLAILDLVMPGMNGAAGVAHFRAAFPGIPVAVISGTDDSRQVRAVIEAGAIGFLSKTMKKETLVDAVRLLLNGETYLPAWALTNPPPTVEERAAAPCGPEPTGLTRRESEILRLLSAGLSNKEMARELNLSEMTVKLHLRSIYRKFGVRSRTQALARVFGELTVGSPPDNEAVVKH